MGQIKIDDDTELIIFQRQHASMLFELTDSGRTYLREWLPWVDMTKSALDSEKFITRTLKLFAEGQGFAAGIWFQGQLAGCISFHHIFWDNQSTSLGYWLGEQFQGHGLMTKAVRAMTDYAFDDYDLNRVEIRCAVENKKSRAIPERLGFTNEGTLRQVEKMSSGNFVDHVVYGLLKTD